jgi:hypothetical protein
LGKAQREDRVLVCNSISSGQFGGFNFIIASSLLNSQLDIENEVNNEMANRMSLFYAEATPMLKTLSNATMHFVSEVSDVK